MIKLLVNLITTFRFLFSLTIPAVHDKFSDIAVIILIIVLFLTDFIDGFLARKFKVQTLYGSMLDTIADKSLSIILILLIMKNNKTLVFVLMLEVLIALINTYGTLTKRKINSSKIGKIKTWFLAITIVISYINKYTYISKISAILTIILQIVTMVGYIKILISKKGYAKDYHKINSFNELKYVLFDTNYYNSVNSISYNSKVEDT